MLLYSSVFDASEGVKFPTGREILAVFFLPEHIVSMSGSGHLHLEKIKKKMSHFEQLNVLHGIVESMRAQFQRPVSVSGHCLSGNGHIFVIRGNQ